ncbi:hypothetical protein, partial [Paramuribaculum intestinale]|uniref:hypothetical protein n=1 Tax=Paramuribaculum intestinale TaxID=2094151 RepID=UPI0027298E9E
SVDEVLILSSKDFNKRQGESQQKIAEEKQKTEDELEYHLIIEDIPSGECAGALGAETIDAYIEVAAPDAADDGRNVLTIYYLSSKSASETAADMIADKLELSAA